MLDRGERVIEVVQQSTPLLVLLGPPESNRVILEMVPLNQQQVSGWRLDASFESNGSAPGHRRDDRVGRCERPLEELSFARDDIEYSVFKDHWVEASGGVTVPDDLATQAEAKEQGVARRRTRGRSARPSFRCIGTRRPVPRMR